MMKLFSLPSHVFIFALSLLSLSAQASLSGISANNEGVQLFEKQRMNEAYNRFAQSLGEMPFEARVHFNLASSYLANKDFEKALSEFGEAARLAEKSGDHQVQFAANFNGAVAATELKQIDQALSLYQNALAIVPDSVETKTNIELLVQSQSGGGGDSKDKKDQDQQGNKDQKKKDGGGKDQNKDQQKPPPDQKPNENNQPQQFNSKDLTQQDAQKIMEELKRQEEDVRARFQNDHVRDVPRDKDW